MASAWAARKQVTYFVLLVIVVLVAGFFIWRSVVSRPTCSDGIENQGEEGIDCGGPCPNKCLGQVEDLIVLWTRFFETAPGKYDLVALVKNPNLSLDIPSLKYYFEIRDKNNILIATTTEEQTFINPGETFPIFEANVAFASSTPGKIFIKLEKNPNWERNGKQKPPLVVSREQFFNTPPFPRLEVTMENKSVSDVTDISLAAVLYDKDQNAVGASLTAVDKISANSSAEAVFTWPSPFPQEPSSTEIFFRTSL